MPKPAAFDDMSVHKNIYLKAKASAPNNNDRNAWGGSSRGSFASAQEFGKASKDSNVAREQKVPETKPKRGIAHKQIKTQGKANRGQRK